MKDGKVLLQVLLCFVLVLGLLLPVGVIEARPTAARVPDEHPGPDSEVHDGGPASATGIEIWDWYGLDAIRETSAQTTRC
jgi:hypothetical protein